MFGFPGGPWVGRVGVVLGMTVALIVSATTASAQMELAVMQGVVKDEAGKPLEDVTFRIRGVDRGRDIVVKSDKNGKFYKRGLQAVDYEIVVEKEGYQPIKDKIRLSAGMDKRFDFKLVKTAPEGAEDFAKGVAAFNSGDSQAAVQAFEAAAQKAPDLPEVRVNLALAYLRASRTADAVAQLEKAAALVPDEPRVLFQLGGAYIEMKDLDKAIAALEKGIAKQPNLNETLPYEATVTLGAVYFAKGDNEKAKAQFEKALAVKPDAVAPKLGLGKVHFSMTEVDKALELFKQVVATAPGTPEAAEAEAFIKALQKVKEPGAGFPAGLQYRAARRQCVQGSWRALPRLPPADLSRVVANVSGSE